MNVATQVALGRASQVGQARECVIVYGSKYCEVKEYDISYLGFVLLLSVLLCFWLGYSFYYILESHYLKGCLILLTPPIIMIMFG